MGPLYNEVLGTMKITLLYQVSRYIRVKKQRNIKSWDQQNDLVIRGFCYIRPLYNEVPLYYFSCIKLFYPNGAYIIPYRCWLLHLASWGRFFMGEGECWYTSPNSPSLCYSKRAAKMDRKGNEANWPSKKGTEFWGFNRVWCVNHSTHSFQNINELKP